MKTLIAHGVVSQINEATIRFPWSQGSQTPVWVGAYGPKALAIAGEVGDGFILQCGDVEIAEWMITTVRQAAADAGRGPDEVAFCVAAPFSVTYGSEASRKHAIDQCRWFGGMVGNHVADIVARYGTDSQVPRALTEYIQGRQDYDYNEHGETVIPTLHRKNPSQIIESGGGLRWQIDSESRFWAVLAIWATGWRSVLPRRATQ